MNMIKFPICYTKESKTQTPCRPGVYAYIPVEKLPEKIK